MAKIQLGETISSKAQKFTSDIGAKADELNADLDAAGRSAPRGILGHITDRIEAGLPELIVGATLSASGANQIAQMVTTVAAAANRAIAAGQSPLMVATDLNLVLSTIVNGTAGGYQVVMGALHSVNGVERLIDPSVQSMLAAQVRTGAVVVTANTRHLWEHVVG